MFAHWLNFLFYHIAINIIVSPFAAISLFTKGFGIWSSMSAVFSTLLTKGAILPYILWVELNCCLNLIGLHILGFLFFNPERALSTLPTDVFYRLLFTKVYLNLQVSFLKAQKPLPAGPFVSWCLLVRLWWQQRRAACCFSLTTPVSPLHRLSFFFSLISAS